MGYIKTKGDFNMDLQNLIYQINEVKQENLRLKNRERELLKEIDKKNEKIEMLLLKLLDREIKMRDLEEGYKKIKGWFYED